ncbi:hypothetical protein DCS_01128 [Drechmeria coniospora]|uniref:Acylphosphatase-like domain-containing protein n=1 Tax=Drechmeria coniospora TaxID=98403 RepID=A0A151GSA1_DRECN|nr:hypothetical protein DCS_01128 [Drechmeria coniospora]KYK59994.1 hypothetical protein DCS_01128 [Drechmeria coniospora]
MAQRLYFVAHGGVVQGAPCTMPPPSLGAADTWFPYGSQDRPRRGRVHRSDARERVEGEAQGEDEALARFFKHVDNGPSHATVVRLTKEHRDLVEGEADFSVRH